MNREELAELQQHVHTWAAELGFQQVGFADTDLSHVVPEYRRWLAERLYGDMSYMNRNVEKRSDPKKLIDGTVCVISTRMDYLSDRPVRIVSDPQRAQISHYATGRDYHKVMRKRLAVLGNRIESAAGGQYRAFVDSAPVLEKPLAAKAGLGWVGKNTLILNKQAGSFFFLGELFTNIPFQTNDVPSEDECGTCKACISICPTGAILGPRKLEARRCISYLTIEHKGAIPLEYRKAIGNRVFGCDDCQLICPWNRFAKVSTETDFMPRHGLDAATLVELLHWDEATFLAKTAGMAIRRVNFSQWVRNLAVAAGNATPSTALLQALEHQKNAALTRQDDMCLEHIDWALEELKHCQAA